MSAMRERTGASVPSAITDSARQATLAPVARRPRYASRFHEAGSGIRNPRSGQALILAVVIMLLLLFLGTIFLRTVLANLGHAEQSASRSNEYAAAEAGIRFADTNLTTSELGADWRPHAPYTPSAVDPRDPDYHWIQPFNNFGDGDPTNDVGGFTRYNLGDSRFLVRVTYNPENRVADASNNRVSAAVMPDVDPSRFVANTDGRGYRFGPSPLSRFVMIEVVGRQGSAADIDNEYQKSPQERDPTVFTGDLAGSTGLRREMIAFKAVGINNYLRFVTDRDRLGRTTYLGVDQAFIRDGSDTVPNGNEVDYPFRLGIDAYAMAGGDVSGWAYAKGSPIRVNGNLVWYGSSPAATGGSPEILLSLLDPRLMPWNVVEVAGEIRREGLNQSNAPTQVVPRQQRAAVLIYDPGQSNPGDQPRNENTATVPLPASSEDASFTQVVDSSIPAGATRALTYADFYLDNKWLTASPAVKPTIDPRRSIRRLEPPQLETTDPGTGVLRYQVMTQQAPALTGSAMSDALSWQARVGARYGYGAGIYIDNARHNSDHSACRGDIQFNHSAERLRDEWMRPYAQLDDSGGKSGWKYPGRVYEPVGTLITLEPDVIRPGGPNAPGMGLMSITRNDYRGWRDPKGDRIGAQTMYFEIRPGGTGTGTREYTLLPKFLAPDPATGESVWWTWDWTNRTWVQYTGTEASAGNGTRYPFNGVIFAEGNVRIRGRLPRDTAEGGMRLTVVSRGTIYIEGNLVRGERADPTDPNCPFRSYIALLARDYVCLNTTQFVQVQTDFKPGTEAGAEAFFWRLPNNEQNLEFQASWDFGMPPNDTTLRGYYAGDDSNADDNRVALFLRHQAANDPVTMQWLVNNAAYQHALTEHGYDSSVPQDFYPLFHTGEWEYFINALTRRPFPMYQPDDPTQVPCSLHTEPGKRNIIRIHNYDPGAAPDGAATTGGDYNLAAVAVQPLDVFITALVYAEHNSWFVIPSTFFQDTTGAGDPEPNAVSRYPRNGEPLDVQITFLGAIAEGQAASLEDVTQWTAHWRGANRTAYETAGDPASTADPGFSKRGGINYAFDSRLITDTRAVRTAPGEPTQLLPSIPRLPMCPDLVYFGERPVQ